MFKNVSFFGVVNQQTGYGLHATNFVKELNNIIPVKLNEDCGEVSISMMDSVRAQHVTTRRPGLSILYNIWESTLQPDKFIENLKYYDQLWVPTEWQRQCSIDQGLDPDFVKVVPEGIDPSIFKPVPVVSNKSTFDFLIVGKWEDRKYTMEMITAFLDVFAGNHNVRLFVKADNPFALDGLTTTEQKLISFGIADPRVIPVHFETPDDHIKRLQSANVYLSCSRAEGWNLPLIEAMACGIPSIALDYSGSTEFAKDALLVKTAGIIKPTNVNGFPECPGQWAEPDYDDLKRVIKDAYDNYHSHKEKALDTSAYIRKNFSWKKAAAKAYDLLCALDSQTESVDARPPQLNTVHQICSQFATDLSNIGYEIGTLDIKQRNDIFVVGCWPNSQERMNTLVETINQIKDMGYPVLISSHYALPAPVIELADYYLYDKQNILSEESFHPLYSRINQAGEREQKESNTRRHDVACLSAMRNAIDFCRGKYDRIYYVEFDLEVSLQDWIPKVIASQKPLVFMDYEKTGLRTDIFAGTVSALDQCIPRISSWKQYMEHGLVQKRDEFSPLEMWLRDHMESSSVMGEVALIECDVHNRFDQVDREIWPDDVFQHHFVEGPYLHIDGISNRVYDVTFSNPVDGTQYSIQQRCGMYSRPGKKIYRDWEIVARHNGEEKHRVKMNLKDKRVLISMGSKALGDTLAWVPFIEEFRKKHQCHVIASTWWNDIFDYPEIEFVPVGSRVDDLYASYELGCYDNDRNRNLEDWRTVTLQQIASDILGLPAQEIRPKLKIPKVATENKYVCFSEHSTMKAKLWNRDGAWQKIADYISSKDLGMISISKEQSNLNNVTKSNNMAIEQTIAVLSGCEFYIGLGHGPSWLAWAVGVPVIMISGFSEPWAEFPTPYRVINTNVCHGCFNDTSVKFDRGWSWCPKNKNYECTREITTQQVIEQIDKLLED